MPASAPAHTPVPLAGQGTLFTELDKQSGNTNTQSLNVQLRKDLDLHVRG